jgi:DNA-binding transcriptional LysR family regulator
MKLAHLRVLVAVADTGSITHAAAQMGLTQSGASQALSALEQQLGVRLAVRERRGATLTAAGEAVVAHARPVLAGLEAIHAAADAARGVERGRLRVASFATVFATLLPPLLRRFRTRHPGIELTALEGTDDEVEAWLGAGTVDVGVVLHPKDGTAAWLGRDEWVAVAPARHALARRPGGRVALDELGAEPFVLATGGCATHGRTVVRDAGGQLADVRVEVRDWASAFALVRDGVGIALVPSLTLPEDRRGLRVLRLVAPVYRDFWLQPGPSSARMPAVRALLELAGEAVARERSADDTSALLSVVR